jgi:hypothetical protein
MLWYGSGMLIILAFALVTWIVAAPLLPGR